jgi:hypothetical protein
MHAVRDGGKETLFSSTTVEYSLYGADPDEVVLRRDLRSYMMWCEIT